MGPLVGGTFPGKRLVRDEHAGPGPGDALRPKGRATYEFDYTRRAGGYIYGAFIPATGEGMTAYYPKRNAQYWAEFLPQVDRWLPPETTQVVAIVDNLASHYATDVLLFMWHHPRWEFLFIPSRCAYLNLIESWWSFLRPLALNGKRIENLEQLIQAFEEATRYANEHKHPYRWGQRRRHQPKRKPGIATKPGITRLFGRKLTA